MKKEELEKKLKISEKTCIHCTTLELAIQVLSIFHQLGLRWNNGTSYVLYHNWDAFKGKTLYYPFEGGLSALGFANLTGGYKVINAEEFIVLHTEEKKFDLENYTPKGELEGFPKEIISRMLECQEEQGNKRNVTVFEKRVDAPAQYDNGFDWDKTQEGFGFWEEVIGNENFNLFFEKYPKQEYQELKNNKKEEDSQEFRVGDEDIDIILDLKGKITNVKSNGNLEIQFEGKSSITEYNLKIEKRPSLLHYRDDYNYNVIDFNNLPKRQKPKRWRAKEGGEYHYIRFYLEDWFSTSTTKENNLYYDCINYNSGNYFQTKKEAQEVADKLNKYFKELINPNK